MVTASRWIMRQKQHVALEEVEFDPKALKPREVAVRVEFTAISPGTECANYLAIDPDVLRPNRWCSYPWQPGYSGVGHVIAVGEAVSEFTVGDLVSSSALRHQSHQAFDVGTVARVPTDINHEHAAFAQILSIAATPIELIEHKPLPVIGVWGQGLIGNLTAQILQRDGGRAVGIDPLPQRRELATRCGIRDTLDPAAPDFADQVKGLTHGAGFDVVVDTTGHAPTTLGLPEFTRARGQIVLMTHWRSQPALDPGPFLYQIFVKGLVLRGAWAGVPALAPGTDRTALLRHRWARLFNEVACGAIVVEPLISHRIRPAQCAQAYEGLCFDRAHWWGVVVDWRD